MDVVFVPLMTLIYNAVSLYCWAVIISIILSWLVAFNIVNNYNPFITSVGSFLNRIVEPALQPIRNFLPNIAGIDLSPLVLLLGLHFLQDVLQQMIIRFGTTVIR